MPKIKTIRQTREEIDWTIAAILERKHALGYTWKAIAEQVGMNYEVLRKLVSERPSVRWPYYTLKKVLQVLGIEKGTYTIKISEGRR